MGLPPLAPFPPVELQKHIVSEEWGICLDSWLLLTQRYLLLSSTTFSTEGDDGASLVRFLTTYVAGVSPTANDTLSTKARALWKNSFLLVHRVFTELKVVSPVLLEWQFLSKFSALFIKIETLKDMLPVAWRRYRLDEDASMRKRKILLMSMMDDAHTGSLTDAWLAQDMAFSRACYPYAQFLMVGSDFLDSLVSAHDRITLPALQERLVALAFVCFESLMNQQEPRTSTLLDHLFSVKSTPLVKALVESTPFLVKFQRHTSDYKKESGRAKPLLEEFSKHDKRSKPKILMRKKVKKGKQKAINERRRIVSREIHVHKLSLVSQVQDLFPELGSGFIIRLLDVYHDNTENITAHLLDDSLPLHLKQADHSETFDISRMSNEGQSQDIALDLIPHITPPLPPIRRNVHDNDDFDNLAIDAFKLHLGRKNPKLTADRLLSSERPSNQKAAILSALAAFDADDDERDDTYDAEDVGGTVDNTFADEEAEVKGDQNDEALFNAYQTSPELFKRDWDTRRGQPRQALKRETGMTDEAIEGWAIMLSRDPKRLKQLERTHRIEHGSQQSTLESTSWKANSVSEAAEDDDTATSYGGGRGRGQSSGTRGRGGRGAFTGVGMANNNKTQVARQRKDANKGSRANHNRRDQRARKMARGGFAG